MVFSKNSVIITKSDLPKTTKIQQPTGRRNDNVDVALVYGDNIDIYDSSESVIFQATSKDSQDTIFILFYDDKGVLLNTDSDLQIAGAEILGVNMLADSNIYISGIIDQAQTYPVNFYNQQGVNQVSLAAPINVNTDMVFVATYSYTNDTWLWVRTVQTTSGNIDAMTMISITDEALLLSVAAEDTLTLYNNGVVVTEPLEGSSNSNFSLIKNNGTMLVSRGVYSTTNTSFLDTSKSSFGNLIAVSTFVNDTTGLFFQAAGSNQGIALPSDHQSCIISLFNAIVNSAIYSLFFVGFDLNGGANIYDPFSSAVNFLNNESLYVNILCKKTAGEFLIATTGGSFNLDENIFDSTDNGYLLLRFEILTSQPRRMVLMNVLSFNGVGASIKLNNNSLISRLGPIIDEPNKPTGIAQKTSTLNLQLSNVNKINIFNASYKSTNDISYSEVANISTDTSNGTIWLEFIDQDFQTYYTAVESNSFTGQASSDLNSTISLLYNSSATLSQVVAPFLQEEIFTHSGTPVIALININNTGPSSPWEPWLICVISVACFSITMAIVYLLVEFYLPLQKKYGKKYKL